MDLDDFYKLVIEWRATYGPPLKAVRMSRASAATLPTVYQQSDAETLYGVPIKWDNRLALDQYVPVYGAGD